jgi:uncharacterized protein YcbX
VPRVVRLSVTPVKALGLLHPEEVELGPAGVAEDRRFYLVDGDARLFSSTQHGPLVQIGADYDPKRERLSLRFPDGRVVEDGVRLGKPVQTDFFGRSVRGRFVEGPFAAALSTYGREPLRLVRAERAGDAFDAEPVTLMSVESVAELARHACRDGLDGRRFRMLVEVEGCEPHEEDRWAGREVRLGEAVVRVLGPVPRCVVTTRSPDTGERDVDTLRVIREYRGLREGLRLDFGVYGRVEKPGRVRVGDAVEPV